MLNRKFVRTDDAMKDSEETATSLAPAPIKIGSGELPINELCKALMQV